MKHYFFLAALMVSFHAYGQDGQRFSFGPAASAGISQIIFAKTDTIPDHSILNRVNFSFQVGGFANYQFANRFSVGTEVFYWFQNGKVKDEFPFVDPSNKAGTETDVYKAGLSYLAVPIFFQYYLSDIILMVGVQGGYKFGESGTLQSTTVVGENTTTGDKTSININFVNYDVGFKAGVLYKLSRNVIGGVEYYNGRINLSQNSTYPYSSRNQYFYASFRYSITHGKRDVIYYN